MFDNLKEFVNQHSTDTDIFCFQEVFFTNSWEKIVDEMYRANILNELTKILPDHQVYFAPVQEWYWFNSRVDFHLEWWIAMFVRKSIDVIGSWVEFVFWEYNSKSWWNQTMPRNFQYITLKVNWEDTTIIHFHWLWNWWWKWDSPDRIKQSKIIKEFMKSRKEQLVLLWDYNLNPDTESLSILSNWMRNLITEYDIKTTRSKLYWKPLQYADYAIISNEIKVQSFAVPYSEASDHLPLILEIE